MGLPGRSHNTPSFFIADRDRRKRVVALLNIQ
jgi:hypothetical protein